MKEYVPGQGSYKVEEAGALTGIGSTYDVDNHFGTLTFNRDDVKIKARGVDFALSSVFNSDHLYSCFMPIVSKSDGPSGSPLVSTPVPPSLMTLPFNQTNFYRFANGWSWKLPLLITGVNASGGPQTAPAGWDIFKYSDGSGKIFDLLSAISQEAWDDGTEHGGGNHCWTEGYEVTYGPEYTSYSSPGTRSAYQSQTGYSKVTIVIPEIQQVIVLWVQRNGTTAPYDFTPVMASGYTPTIYLSDGRKVNFTRKGLISSITDAAGKNTLTYSYVSGMDALIGTVTQSSSRKTFAIAAADFAKVTVGDLVIINDEIKVISAIPGFDGLYYWVSTSSNFDVALPTGTGPQYTIVKGQLQMITHTDGRAVKFYYFTSGANKIMAIMISSDQIYNDFNNGDQFLGIYTINPVNQLAMYQTVNSLSPGNSTTFSAAIAASPSTYYTALQQITYLYGLTLTPNPSTDTITIINNAGATTIYYFQSGGFCTHSWNNSFFHTGKCRRGGTTTVMNIERPDFYIGNANNYISINRINQNAFYDASKADYQKDANAAEFEENSQFTAGMEAASLSLSIAGLAAAANPFSFPAALIGAAQAALGVVQYAHQIAQQDADAYLSAHAPAVSDWELVSEQVTSNRVILSAALAVAPMQNDVYGCVQLNGSPDMRLKVNATSQDSTKVYIDYTNGGSGTPLTAGDYIFIRGFMAQIQLVGKDTWQGASENYIITTNPLPFTADEGEYVIAVYLSGGKIPTPQTFYGYYLNKPKCVRIELKDSFAAGSAFWKRIDYEYSYKIQGQVQTDSFDEGGFDESNIEGPELTSFSLSDIKISSTNVITSEANTSTENDLFQDVYTFEYDVKNFHKGQSSVTRLRFDQRSNTWLFVDATVSANGRPCFNAGYYGVTAEAYFAGGDVTNISMGGAAARRNTGYRFDVYGRKINERTVSSSYEGRKIKNKWTQYCCTSQDASQPPNWDLDPLRQFAVNYLSSGYRPLMNTFFALGVVGATSEEVDAQQDTKVVLKEFDLISFNEIMVDIIVDPTLINYTDLLSANSPNWEGVSGSTIITNPLDLRWSPDGINFNPNMSLLQIGDNAMQAHMLTYFTYDANNNLITIQKPMGNIFNLTYGTGWASSYIASDYKTLPNNIAGATQYIVNLYTYDIKGRLTSRTTVLSTDIAGQNPYSYQSSAPKAETQYTYDGLDRLLTKAVGDGTTQTITYQVTYMDTGDGFYEGPYMIETDYLGFRTKTLYDTKYRVVSVEKFKPNQSVSGNLAYANSIMSNGECNSPLTPPAILGQLPLAPINGTFALSLNVGSPGGITGASYLLTKTSAANAGVAQAFLGPSSPTNLGGFVAGHTYKIGAWVYVPTQTLLNINNLSLSIAYYNAGAWAYATAYPVASFGAFQYIVATVTIPSAATGVSVSPQIGTAEAAGTIFYISDITLQDMTVAAEVQISGNWNVYDEGLDKVVQHIEYTTPAEISSQSIITKNTYDGIGRLLQVAYKNNDPNYQGDSVYHVIKAIEYDETQNGVITYDYVDDNALDYVETDTYNDWLGRGPAKIVTYTGLGGSGLPRTTTNHYRHDGKLIKTDLPNGESFLYQYDNLGKLEKITYPDGTATRNIYDLNSNKVQIIDRRNLSTSMTYNQSDMEVARVAIDANRGNTTIATLYTQFGPATVTKSEGAAQIVEDNYNYHWSGKVSLRDQIMDGYTMQVAYGFDAAGNLITVTPTGSGSSPWTNTFNIIPQFHPYNPDNDNFNREAVADNSTGNNIVTVEHDLLGNITDFKYGSYATPLGQMNYKYDKFLRQISLISGEPTPDLSITLTRDFIGNILSRVEPAYGSIPAVNNQYTYDGMNRLSSGEGATELYDELSNLVALGSSSYIYQDPAESDVNDQMRLASFNNGTLYTYSYDSNGNPIAVSNRFTSLSYDNLNALRQIVYSQTDNYWYDASGLRVKKTENATGAWQTTYTMFEGDNPLMQEVYTASGRMQTVFNIIVKGKILAQYKMVYPSTLSVVYFYLDNLDSRRVVLSTTPAVVDRYHYSAWGVLTQDFGSDSYGSFTGKDYDATGLIYFNARYYDPTTGRFVTEDHSRKGVNWYAYCENDPINKTDPTGRDVSDPGRSGFQAAPPVAGQLPKPSTAPSVVPAVVKMALSTINSVGQVMQNVPTTALSAVPELSAVGGFVANTSGYTGFVATIAGIAAEPDLTHQVTAGVSAMLGVGIAAAVVAAQPEAAPISPMIATESSMAIKGVINSTMDFGNRVAAGIATGVIYTSGLSKLYGD